MNKFIKKSLIMASAALSPILASATSIDDVYNNYPVNEGMTDEVVVKGDKTSFELWSPKADAV